MNDKVKATLTSSYLHMLFEFADPASIKKEELSDKLTQPIERLFDNQRNADKAKKVLGKLGFSRVVFCYFDQFQTQDGIDFKKLEQALQKNHKVILRHLGKDKLNYLKLLSSIAQTLEPKTKGLLGAA